MKQVRRWKALLRGAVLVVAAVVAGVFSSPAATAEEDAFELPELAAEAARDVLADLSDGVVMPPARGRFVEVAPGVEVELSSDSPGTAVVRQVVDAGPVLGHAEVGFVEIAEDADIEIDVADLEAMGYSTEEEFLADVLESARVRFGVQRREEMARGGGEPRQVEVGLGVTIGFDRQTRSDQLGVGLVNDDLAVTAYVQPTAGLGARVLVQLHDETAPTSHEFSLTLPSGLSVLQLDDGSAVIFDDEASELSPPVGMITAPFAFDAVGRSLPVVQRVTGDRIILEIDTAGATFPVVADPQYAAINCGSSTQYADTHSYLWHSNRCPYGMTFVYANGYWPERIRIDGTNSWMNGRRSGECGFMPDTGPWWDFQAPCKAHDYCYDMLRVKAPFDYRPSVDRDECDDELYDGMDTHCQARSNWTRGSCNLAKNQIIDLVRAVGSDPAQSRPTSWPSTQWLSNRGFEGGFAWWNAFSFGNRSMNRAVYAGGHTGDFLAFNCNNSSAHCSVWQDTRNLNTNSWTPRGGESVRSSIWIKCSRPGCPYSMALWGFANGGSYLESIYTSNATTSWSKKTKTVRLDRSYDDLRFEVYNNSTLEADNLWLDDTSVELRAG